MGGGGQSTGKSETPRPNNLTVLRDDITENVLTEVFFIIVVCVCVSILPSSYSGVYQLSAYHK